MAGGIATRPHARAGPRPAGAETRPGEGLPRGLLIGGDFGQISGVPARRAVVRKTLPFALALGLLTSCTGRENFVVWDPPRGPTSPGLPFDGAYKGDVQLTAGAGPVCPNSASGILTIGDGTLVYAYTPATIFIVVIAKDGKLHAERNGATLDGTLIDGHLAATVVSGECRTSFAFRRLQGL